MLDVIRDRDLWLEELLGDECMSIEVVSSDAGRGARLKLHVSKLELPGIREHCHPWGHKHARGEILRPLNLVGFNRMEQRLRGVDRDQQVGIVKS